MRCTSRSMLLSPRSNRCNSASQPGPSMSCSSASICSRVRSMASRLAGSMAARVCVRARCELERARCRED
eukprot:9480171-Alexandrium_andersonii.AAC.1